MFQRLLTWLFKIRNVSCLPNKLLRGVSADGIDGEGRATAQLFRFHPSKDRDNFEEASINWYDNDEAMTILMSQKKEGTDTIQFPFGVAVMSLERLDEVIRLSGEELSYERDPIIGNPYHGNILQKSGLQQARKRLLAASLALLCVERIEKRIP